MLKTAKSQGFAMLIGGREKSNTPKTVLDLRSSSF
jgi:ribosome modulation factor